MDGFEIMDFQQVGNVVKGSEIKAAISKWEGDHPDCEIEGPPVLYPVASQTGSNGNSNRLFVVYATFSYKVKSGEQKTDSDDSTTK